jgi:hypothetical protein
MYLAFTCEALHAFLTPVSWGPDRTFFVFCFCFVCFETGVLPGSPGWLRLYNPVSASLGLGLQATTPRASGVFVILGF